VLLTLAKRFVGFLHRSPTHLTHDSQAQQVAWDLAPQNVGRYDFSDAWSTRFVKHELPEYAMKRQRAISPVHLPCNSHLDHSTGFPQKERVITPEEMKSWYAELTPLFVLKKFKPVMVFNWDEAFLHVDDESIAWVCCRRDKKPTVMKAAQNSEHLTVGCMRPPPLHPPQLTRKLPQFIDASGGLMTPVQLVLPSVEAPNLQNSDLYQFYTFSGQAAGWITRDIFNHIVHEVILLPFEARRSPPPQHFIPQVRASRTRHGFPANEPAVLFLDGHLSHEDSELLEELRTEGIDVVEFYPHASHIQQPLDGGFFRVWRCNMRKVRSHRIRTPSILPQISRPHSSIPLSCGRLATARQRSAAKLCSWPAGVP